MSIGFATVVECRGHLLNAAAVFCALLYNCEMTGDFESDPVVLASTVGVPPVIIATIATRGMMHYYYCYSLYLIFVEAHYRVFARTDCYVPRDAVCADC